MKSAGILLAIWSHREYSMLFAQGSYRLWITRCYSQLRATNFDCHLRVHAQYALMELDRFIGSIRTIVNEFWFPPNFMYGSRTFGPAVNHTGWWYWILLFVLLPVCSVTLECSWTQICWQRKNRVLYIKLPGAEHFSKHLPEWHRKQSMEFIA